MSDRTSWDDLRASGGLPEAQELYREQWKSHFPKSVEEAQKWQPFQQHHALATRVLAVARTRIEGAWCAYIDAVTGWDHSYEARAVMDQGAKLPEHVALILFPKFTGLPYAK